MKESLFFRFCILYTAGCIICSSLYIYMMIQGVLDVKKEKKCWNNYGLIKVLHLAFASLESLGQDKTFKSLESLVRLFQKVLKLIIL